MSTHVVQNRLRPDSRLILKVAAQEALIVYNCGEVIADGGRLSPANQARLLCAVSRLLNAAEVMHAR